MSKVYLDDARNLKNKIKPASLDVTITSPPYFDMKDYGHSEQIGFGQTYEEYLKELQSIFKEVYSATKNSGSLWVVIDTFKRDGVVVPLPFDFAREISLVGWKLQDIIVWKKDKTVPWSKKGATRKIFEYVLFFSKGSDFKYYSERAREITELKEWWIRYPERYSPNGKSLEEIWEFSIPTQG
jgi:DNA modification methylase